VRAASNRAWREGGKKAAVTRKTASTLAFNVKKALARIAERRASTTSKGETQRRASADDLPYLC